MKRSEHLDGSEIKVRKLIFTTSNVVSFSRIPASLLAVWSHYTNEGVITWVFNAVVVYIVLSDFLDGWLARVLDQVSELGKVIDPIGDKFAALVLFLYAIAIGVIPSYLLMVIVLRDMAIVIGALIIRRKRGKVPMSVMSGKVAVNVLALYWLVVMYLPQEKAWHEMFLYATLVMLGYSFIQYMRRFYKIWHGYNFN